MIRVLLSENTPGAADEIARKLAQADDIKVVGYARDGLEAAQMAVQLEPDAALIFTDMSGMDGFQACHMASLAAPKTGYILIAPADSNNQETWQKAMNAGARGLVTTAASADELIAAVRQAGALTTHMAKPEFQLVTDVSKMPVTIAVTGAKGGIGKTTIATNLAICLQKEFPGQVVLVDFLGQYGDVPLFLNMQPAGGLGELMLLEELDADMVRAQLAQHSSGLWVLAAPDGNDMSRIQPNIRVPRIADLISILRSEYRFVVFDAPPLVGDVSWYLLSRCNYVIVVTYLIDLAAIRDTATLIETLINSQRPAESIKLVVNRRSQRNPFSTADLQQTVNHDIAAEIPEDSTAVTSALNEGIPLVLKAPSSPVAHAIRGLTQDIIAELPKRGQQGQG